MNPADLVTSNLINYCSQFKTIIILGYTKTGKVTIAKKLAQKLNYPLFESDYYINIEDRKQSLYNLIDDILPYYQSNQPLIIEGILGFRLLRKGLQLNNFSPDLIIKTKCNDETIKHFYRVDNEESKINRALSFNKGLNKIWDEYKEMLRNNLHNKIPKFIELETTLPEYSYFL
jgi:adenylate kinase family enzyme